MYGRDGTHPFLSTEQIQVKQLRGLYYGGVWRLYDHLKGSGSHPSTVNKERESPT